MLFQRKIHGLILKMILVRYDFLRGLFMNWDNQINIWNWLGIFDEELGYISREY